MPPSLEKKGVGGYLFRVGYVLDVLGNVLIGGKVESISSRLGKRKLQQGGVLNRWDWGGVARPLDAMLEWIDRGHSLDAIDPDRGDPPRPPKVP